MTADSLILFDFQMESFILYEMLGTGATELLTPLRLHGDIKKSKHMEE